MLDDNLPIDWADDVLAERATEDEMDRPMTEIFWSWDGPEEGDDPLEDNEEEPR
jgi:hypothetical protein